MPSLLWIFIDGLGIGRNDPSVNPLARFEPYVLRIFDDRCGPFPKGGICIATDACLEVPGLPQSATGQATLFTGLNTARIVGGHRQGYPDAFLRRLVTESSVFTRLKASGRRVSFANVYTPRFFEQRPRWVSVTTVMAESSGIRLRTFEDLLEGRGVFMDFTNRLLRQNGFDLPEWTPEQAGRQLVRLARDHDLCLYEYFLTDLMGHRGSFEEAQAVLHRLDGFLAAVLDEIDLDDCSLLVTSDHGNIEDKTVRQHTRNPVPTLAWGRLAALLSARSGALRLDHVAPLVLDYLGWKPPARTARQYAAPRQEPV
jgi:hypothetical protein